MGLTQVMPATASGIAAALAIEPFESDSLFRPARSLQFGAYYVSLQLEAMGSSAAALAAYNGGPRNAAIWAESFDPASDPAAYLESITFSETYRYVELVLTGYARYRSLAAE